jgi:hypothetical protein
LHSGAQAHEAENASVYQKRGRGTWYLRVKDAVGRWADIASTAKTKTEARRLAADLERKAERQRLGLEPFAHGLRAQRGPTRRVVAA